MDDGIIVVGSSNWEQAVEQEERSVHSPNGDRIKNELEKKMESLIWKPARLPLAGEWVLVWTSTERGEGRSLAGLSLVLAPGAPVPGGGVLSAAAPRTSGGAGDDTMTRSTSSGMAVGSRLHVERKP